MNPTPTLRRPTRLLIVSLGLVAVTALAIGWTAGAVAASSGSRAATPSAASSPVGADIPGAPGAGVTLPQTAGGATTSGMAASIAYPVPGYNSLGVAPEGTILVQGTATAAMKADGSDKAAALKKASDAALADAHAQALTAAASMGVQLAGIYSVSLASSTSYMYATPGCGIAPPVPGAQTGSTGSAGSAPLSSPMVCPMVGTATATSSELVVTLMVAYRYA
jgi:hypothetical protein